MDDTKKISQSEINRSIVNNINSLTSDTDKTIDSLPTNLYNDSDCDTPIIIEPVKCSMSNNSLNIQNIIKNKFPLNNEPSKTMWWELDFHSIELKQK